MEFSQKRVGFSNRWHWSTFTQWHCEARNIFSFIFKPRNFGYWKKSSHRTSSGWLNCFCWQIHCFFPLLLDSVKVNIWVEIEKKIETCWSTLSRDWKPFRPAELWIRRTWQIPPILWELGGVATDFPVEYSWKNHSHKWLKSWVFQRRELAFNLSNWMMLLTLIDIMESIVTWMLLLPSEHPRGCDNQHSRMMAHQLNSQGERNHREDQNFRISTQNTRVPAYISQWFRIPINLPISNQFHLCR